MISITIMAYRTGILAWYDCPISTGKVEGINNKIKVMKRVAYDFRDEKVFSAKVICAARLPHHSKYRMNLKYVLWLMLLAFFATSKVTKEAEIPQEGFSLIFLSCKTFSGQLYFVL